MRGLMAAIMVVVVALAAVQAQGGKKVELTGKLQTGIVAIGGETTGTVLETKAGSYELDFGPQQNLRDKSEKLNGKQVHVTGTLVIRKGVEVKERRIVTVQTLSEAKGK